MSGKVEANSPDRPVSQIVTVVINGTEMINVQNHGLPANVGLLDIEQMLTRNEKLGRVQEAYLNGKQIERRGEGVPVDLFLGKVVVVLLDQIVKSPNNKEGEMVTENKSDVMNQVKQIGSKKRAANKVKQNDMDTEKTKPFEFNLETLKNFGVNSERVLGKAKTTEEIRDKIIQYIKTYNQLRDLEDRNLENSTNVKYSTRDEFFRKMKDRLLKDDLGGYMYQTVKGYDLEELIHIATELEDKQMEIEDWVHLYKHLVDYFGD